MSNPAVDLRRALGLLGAAALLSFASGCGSPDEISQNAANLDETKHRFTLWIHGMAAKGHARIGDYRDFSMWGEPGRTGVNPRAVNWDGAGHIAETNQRIRMALDCFCTGENSCYIAAHSAGGAQIGYALDHYGDTDRPIQDATPNGSGECSGTGGTQKGWNIEWVDLAASAAGGSELADLGYWTFPDGLVSDLRTATMRTLYDHNNTQGVPFRMFAGAKGALYAGVLPGQDDEAVAYHSSGGSSEVASLCNPGDFFCDGTLELGEAASEVDGKRIAKYAYHSTVFRDDEEAYEHSNKRSWAGITSVVLADVQKHAR